MSKIEDVVPSEVKRLENKTILSIKRVVYNWTVNNFSVRSKCAKQTIRSPLFMIDNVPYQLRLETPENVDDAEAAVPVAISLCRGKKDESDQYINYKISLLDRKGNPLVTQEEEDQFFKKQPAGRRMVFCLFENHEDCFQSLHDDALHVRCEAWFLVQSHIIEKNDTILDKLFGSKKDQKSHRRKLGSQEGTRFSSLIFSFLLILVYCFVLNSLFGGVHHRCMKWNKEVDKLVINSTHQMINIAEALNLTDVKDKAAEFLYAYAKQHDISVLDLPSLYK